MSFWNFLCGFAVFNAVCDMFSSKRKPVYPDAEPYYRHRSYEHYPEYEHDIDEIRDSDIDAMQERIDELENRLAECDVMSERYDEILYQIDELQERVDEMEDMREQYEEYQDELEDLDLYDDIYYGDCDR